MSACSSSACVRRRASSSSRSSSPSLNAASAISFATWASQSARLVASSRRACSVAIADRASLSRACASATAVRSLAASPNASRMCNCASGSSNACASCCPCTFTSARPISASRLAVTGDPFTHARARPPAPAGTSRLRTSVPSLSMPRASSAASRSRRSPTSNTPSTVALSAPVRTKSLEARSPIRSPSAPTMIDFPAPVSPVSTLKPRASGSVTASMIARFRMRSSVSMLLHSARCAQAPHRHDAGMGAVFHWSRSSSPPQCSLRRRREKKLVCSNCTSSTGDSARRTMRR